jgi:hypothetical protein
MSLNDALLSHLQKMIHHNKTDFTDDEFMHFMQFKRIDRLFLDSNMTIDDFCIFLLSSVAKSKPPHNWQVGNDANGLYSPEQFFTKRNTPYLRNINVTLDDHKRRINIYDSPLYASSRFLPSQYAPHNRMYAKPDLASAIELVQPAKGWVIKKT